MSVVLINPIGEKVAVKDSVVEDRLANGWKLPKKTRRGRITERVNNGRRTEKRSDGAKDGK